MSFPESIPLRREVHDTPSAASGELVWLGLLVPLVLLLFLILRRIREAHGARSVGGDGDATSVLGWLKGKAHGAVHLRESKRLTPTHSLHEVEWRGRVLLIGCSGQAVQLLAEVPASAPESAGSANTPTGDLA